MKFLRGKRRHLFSSSSSSVVPFTRMHVFLQSVSAFRHGEMEQEGGGGGGYDRGGGGRLLDPFASHFLSEESLARNVFQYQGRTRRREKLKVVLGRRLRKGKVSRNKEKDAGKLLPRTPASLHLPRLKMLVNKTLAHFPRKDLYTTTVRFLAFESTSIPLSQTGGKEGRGMKR